MNVPAQTIDAGSDPATVGPMLNMRQERNRQRRAWRISPANPRNKSRGGTKAARYDYPF
jgi:hypothetical protein